MIALLPVFAPNELGFQRQLRSIVSLTKWFDGDIFVSGWIKEDEWWDTFLYSLEKYDNVLVDYQSSNLGKSCNVNYLFKRYCDEDYFYTQDSDIVVESNIFPRLINLQKEISRVTELGVISLNQTDDNCQLLEHQNVRTIIGNEHVSWNDDGRGLAGGALYVSSKAFKDVGGYKEFGAYGGDDGYLLNDLSAKDYFSCCANDITVQHPSGDIKEGYLELKKDILHNGNVERLDKFWGN